MLRLRTLLGLACASATLHAQDLTWTQRNTGVAAGLQYTAAAYGNGRYAVTAYGSGTTAGTFQSQVATSADGVSWTVTNLPTAPVVRGIAFGGGLWVVPCERNGSDSGNTQNILTSPDGTTWTARTTGAGTLWKVAHTTVGSGNLYVAGGLASNSPAGSNVAYSPDAIAWTRTNLGGADARVNHLVAGGGVFVAATQVGGQVYRSTNGATWTTVTLPQTISINFVLGLAYAGGEFIAAVQADGGAARLYTSADGTTWTALGRASPAAPASISLSALGAAGAATTGARVMVAGSSQNLNNFTASPYVFHTTGALTTWTTQQFGSGNFANHNFAFFANGLWLVGNNATQLFTASDTATGSGPGGGSTGGGTGGTGGGSTGGGSTGGSGTTGGATTFSYLSNVSVRARAGSGDSTLIVGVTVGGNATASKSALIRGVGPALTPFGVGDALADPVLTVLRGTTTVVSNDDWANDAGVTTTSAAVGAFPLPASSRDAAINGTGIAAGGYSIQLTGKGGATGTGLIELYDATPGANMNPTSARFTNLSARTFGGTGGDTLIVGFSLSGNGPRRVLVRASGPALAAFGLSGTMPNPKLELFQGQTKLTENDDWAAGTLADQNSVGAFAFPANSRDAVIVTTLQPGGYTAQVTGGTTGVVLVELYELP